MNKHGRPITILYADDDPEDRMLVMDAWKESRVGNDLHVVEDGEQLMDYLYRRNGYAALTDSPFPGMILLDLNMPKKDGREALKEIKADSTLRRIPIVVLTTSQAEEDIFRAYDLGVNSFIVKPVTFKSLVDVTKILGKYWLEIVELPPDDAQA